MLTRNKRFKKALSPHPTALRYCIYSQHTEWLFRTQSQLQQNQSFYAVPKQSNAILHCFTNTAFCSLFQKLYKSVGAFLFQIWKLDRSRLKKHQLDYRRLKQFIVFTDSSLEMGAEGSRIVFGLPIKCRSTYSSVCTKIDTWNNRPNYSNPDVPFLLFYICITLWVSCSVSHCPSLSVSITFFLVRQTVAQCGLKGKQDPEGVWELQSAFTPKYQSQVLANGACQNPCRLKPPALRGLVCGCQLTLVMPTSPAVRLNTKLSHLIYELRVGE